MRKRASEGDRQETMKSREKLVIVPEKKRDSAREKEKDRQNGEKRITWG